ncbi:15764_t:CDS:2, partial [Gigaspora margarita]
NQLPDSQAISTYDQFSINNMNQPDNECDTSDSDEDSQNIRFLKKKRMNHKKRCETLSDPLGIIVISSFG